MAKGKFELMKGPLDAPRKPKGSLGGEDVNQPGPMSCSDPLGLNKTKGAKGKKSRDMYEMYED